MSPYMIPSEAKQRKAKRECSFFADGGLAGGGGSGM